MFSVKSRVDSIKSAQDLHYLSPPIISSKNECLNALDLEPHNIMPKTPQLVVVNPFCNATRGYNLNDEAYLSLIAEISKIKGVMPLVIAYPNTPKPLIKEIEKR